MTAKKLVVNEVSINPQPGDVVQHYKGGLYIVLMLAHCEVNGETRVIYSECKPPARRALRAWDRRLSDWCAFAKDDSGAKVPRYRNIRLARGGT